MQDLRETDAKMWVRCQRLIPRLIPPSLPCTLAHEAGTGLGAFEASLHWGQSLGDGKAASRVPLLIPIQSIHSINPYIYKSL